MKRHLSTTRCLGKPQPYEVVDEFLGSLPHVPCFRQYQTLCFLCSIDGFRLISRFPSSAPTLLLYLPRTTQHPACCSFLIVLLSSSKDTHVDFPQSIFSSVDLCLIFPITVGCWMSIYRISRLSLHHASCLFNMFSSQVPVVCC